MTFYPRGGNYLPYLQRPRDDWDVPMSRPTGLRRPLSGRRDGPLLDRDYGDFRPYRRIDSGSLIYPRPPSPGFGRKHMMELEDQLKMCKEELARREKLIEEMNGFSLNSPHALVTPAYGQSQACGICNHGNIPDMTKSDIESLQVEVENLNSQVQEMESHLRLRDKKIQELKLSCQLAKEKELIGEENSENGDGSPSRGDLAVSILQREIRDAEKRTLQLESQLRELKEELARVQQERASASAKADDLAQENAKVKNELSLVKSSLQNSETELQLSCEKINQMTLELERVCNQAIDHRSDVENIRVEKDAFLNEQKQLENELTVMHGRLEASNRELAMARTELEQHMTHCGGLNRERRLQESVTRSAEAQLASLKETFARMLSDDSVKVEPSEERIRERVEELMVALKEKTLVIEGLERKSQELADKFDKLDAHFQAPNSVKRHHGSLDIADLEARLRRAEQELMSRDESREGTQSDKEKFWKYLTRLCVALEMEPVAVSLGLDEAVVTILGRVEEIMKKDVLALSDMKARNQHLQQKLSRMTDQLESKESHLELLRRKVASLQQQVGTVKTHSEREKDEFSRNRKMQKLIEKYRHELNECHAEIQELKSRLLYTCDVKERTFDKNHELIELEMEMGHLEQERLRQASKIAGLERVVHSASDEIMEKKEVANNTIHALSLELRRTKEILEEVTSRESKLLELRLVIARMLGLDVATLTVPDYEIISRLEKLILANQANATTAVVFDNAVADLNDGFQAGYHQASHSLSNSTRHRMRSRSLSPRRRVDKKTY